MSTIDLHHEAYVEKRAAECGKDASEFIVSVLEHHRQLRSEVEAMLLERIDGPFEEWTDEDVEDIRREGIELINQRKGK
jgi:hypothetical protein